ncbi:hypothetical protein ABZ479_04800 [Streptomyces sp. NPDC005722]
MGEFGFVCLILLSWTAAGVSARTAWLVWHERPASAAVPAGRFHAYDPADARGRRRGLVPRAGGHLGLACCLTGAFLATRFGVAVAVPALVLLALGGPVLVLGAASHATVRWFNPPRFLVPPRLRDEVGTVIESRRHREELRAALREARERDL